MLSGYFKGFWLCRLYYQTDASFCVQTRDSEMLIVYKEISSFWTASFYLYQAVRQNIWQFS